LGAYWKRKRGKRQRPERGSDNDWRKDKEAMLVPGLYAKMRIVLAARYQGAATAVAVVNIGEGEHKRQNAPGNARNVGKSAAASS
jgi:hypothetical protein